MGQTDRQSDRQTDRRTDRGIAQCPPMAGSIINTPQMTWNLKDVSDLLRREHGCINLLLLFPSASFTALELRTSVWTVAKEYTRWELSAGSVQRCVLWTSAKLSSVDVGATRASCNGRRITWPSTWSRPFSRAIYASTMMMMKRQWRADSSVI